MVSIMSHISSVPANSVEAEWDGAIARKVFTLHLDRLQISTGVCIEGAIPSSYFNPLNTKVVLSVGLRSLKKDGNGNCPSIKSTKLSWYASRST